MLHLKFALNLDDIVDDIIIPEISTFWDKPFDAPTVIFPDPKLEQWFKFRWIQKHKVLANLNKKTIDQFLFEILVGNDKNKKKLSADLLRNVMISYLIQKQPNGQCNYELLGDSVKSYLESYDATAKESRLDENRLFDFTNTMAGLFLEYETSRPNNFFYDTDINDQAEGILDCWSQNGLKDFFITKNKVANEKEHWQRQLYSALFHSNGGKSLLTQVFEKLGKESGNPTTYLTLPFLFKDCETKFNYNSKKPVFIIGLGGMGQFYRVILHEFAKNHEVYAYIQNPCMEFWEDYTKETFKPKLPNISVEADDESEPCIKADENDLLRYWGKAGRDNIRLWSMACDYDSTFPSVQDEKGKAIPTDSLLHQIQWSIAHRQNKLPEASNILADESGNFFANDSSFRITSAPSKIREVEAMHTHICKLLNGSATADGKPAKISDILVIAPNIDDYRTAIYQVFDQSSEYAASTQKALHIPFSIVDSQASNSLVASALSTLFQLREKKALNRPDFFSLVRNPVVQLSRGIDSAEVSSWESWITEMNIFRDRNQDWHRGVKRLLMGRFSSNIITVGDESIAPYEDFESHNDNSLYRFIDCVESLEKWISDEWPEQITETKLDDVTDFLDSWLLMHNPPKGFGGESIIYSNVSEAKKDLKYFYAAGSESITWKMISQVLMTAAQGSEYSCGNLFVNGLTFMKFTPNRTLPVKYLFILGMDANSFPGVSRNNTLDLRKSVRPWPGDDNPITKNRYAFLCQLMSTREGLFISYVNKNLQKDEDFYPSSVINDIRSFLKNSLPAETEQEKIWPVVKINLNEDRSWSELFTQREMRNKLTLKNFHHDDFENTSYGIQKSDKTEFPQRVYIYQFKQFLEDPFQFHASQNLNIDNEFQDEEKLEFEPIEAEFLTKYNLQKMITCIDLGIPENEHIQTKDDFVKYVESQGILPAKPFFDKEMDQIKNTDSVKLAIESRYPRNQYNYSRKEVSVNLASEIPGKEEKIDWTISGTTKAFIESLDHNEVCIIDFCLGNSKKKHYLSPYIAALVYISSLTQENTPKVSIQIAGFSGSLSEPVVIEKTPAEAAELLCKMYHRVFIRRIHNVLPIEMFPTQNSYWDYMNTLKDFNKTSNNAPKSPWTNFAGKNLFDLESVCGYTPENFDEKWNSDVRMQCELMPDLMTVLGFEKKEA